MGLYWQGQMTSARFCCSSAYADPRIRFSRPVTPPVLVSEARVSGFNFVVTEITPHAVNNIGWRTLLMFGIFCVAMSLFIVYSPSIHSLLCQ
jgi:hypothetical protein